MLEMSIMLYCRCLYHNLLASYIILRKASCEVIRKLICRKGSNSNINSNEIEFAQNMIVQSEGWSTGEDVLPNILVELLLYMCPIIQDPDFVIKGLITKYAFIIEDYSALYNENIPRSKCITYMHNLRY